MFTLHTIIKFSSIKLVLFYRKFLSPYKGFRCGHAYHTNSDSCSTYGLKQLQQQPNPIEAIYLIRHRLKACSHITALFRNVEPVINSHVFSKQQGGFVDCAVGDCNGCDLPDCNIFKHNDCLDVCDCSDIFDFNKNKKNIIANSPNTLATDTAALVAAQLIAKNKGSYIIPNFQLLDELENGYLLYQHNLTKEYYKIHNTCIDCPLDDILNLNTDPATYKLTEEKVKKILKYRKKINLNKD